MLKSFILLIAAVLLLLIQTFSQISTADADSAFSKSRLKIQGEGRTCKIINTLSGDLNNDSKEDLLVYYTCEINGTIGKGTTGGGCAIWINKEGYLQFLLSDEKKFGLVPLQILSNGLISCNRLQFKSDSDKPDVAGKLNVKLSGDSLKILK